MRYYYKSIDGKALLNLKDQIEDENYIEITEEEFNSLNTPQLTDTQKIKIQIQELKNKLAETDYQAIKFAEGILSDEEYASMKTQREEWRAQINNLEAQL